METGSNKIREHVENYFRKNLPQYDVLEVRKKSSHPDDGHLYMVSARKEDNSFAVWTSWNEDLQTLNHGHYDLKSVKDCEELFAQFQNEQHYFAIYKCSQNARLRLFVTDSEKDAQNFCEEHQWELTDENGFVWSLDYSEIKGNEQSDKEEV